MSVKIVSISTIALLLSVPSASFAVDEAYFDGTSAQPVGGNSGDRIIRRIAITSKGVVRLRANTAFANPDGCDSSQEIAVTDRSNGVDNPYYSEQYALAVASFLQGKKVSARISGCKPIDNESTRPAVQELYSYE